MPLFIEKILELEMSLVHVISRICGELFVSASSGVGSTVESFEAGEKSACAELDDV